MLLMNVSFTSSVPGFSFPKLRSLLGHFWRVAHIAVGLMSRTGPDVGKNRRFLPLKEISHPHGVCNISVVLWSSLPMLTFLKFLLYLITCTKVPLAALLGFELVFGSLVPACRSLVQLKTTLSAVPLRFQAVVRKLSPQIVLLFWDNILSPCYKWVPPSDQLHHWGRFMTHHRPPSDNCAF